MEGVGTTLQLVPLKCSASVSNSIWPVVGFKVLKTPTAQMSLEAIAEAPYRVPPATIGLGTTTRLAVSKVRASRYSTRGHARSARAGFAPRRQLAIHQCVITESPQVRNFCWQVRAGETTPSRIHAPRTPRFPWPDKRNYQMSSVT